MAVRVGGGPGWTRRAVLAAGSAAVTGAAAGCSWFGPEPPPLPPPPDPLEPLLAGTRALIARYQQVLARHPDLTGRLEPLHRAHLAHEAALLAAIGRPELATPSANAGSWSPPLEPAVPAQPAATLAGLRQAEQAAAQVAAEACLSAPPARAGLLGSVTAARATHAAVLDE